MKYHYFYQSKKNENLDGWIVAKNRDDAYAQLKKQGIKPFKVLGRNPIGWKRWAAITVSTLAAVYFFWAWRTARKAAVPSMMAVRSTLYGDASMIQRLSSNGWRTTFPNEGDAWFARHAMPGVVCDCPSNCMVNISSESLQILDKDSEELRKMKRMVNGMKKEMQEYLDAGGALEDYIDLCCERVRTEKGIKDSINGKFIQLRKKDPLEVADDWEKQNKTLRSLGLPTVPLPVADEE